MGTPRRRLVLLVCGTIAAMIASTIAGCHTVEGVGQDVAALGDGLSHVASTANPTKR